MTEILRPYQEIGRDFLASRNRALLADEMRLGKTPQAILAAHKRGAQTVAVITPAIAVRQWEGEFERWWPGPQPRKLIVSWDRARLMWQSGVSGNVDVLIPDEGHFAKNPTALRTKMLYGKTGFGHHAGAIWPLSGTPAPTHAGELWPMLRAFGVVGMGYSDFCDRYCYFDATHSRVLGTREKMIPELRQMLAPIMLRRKRKEVAPEMPDIDFQFLQIDGEHPDYDNVNAETPRPDVAMAKVKPLAEQIEFAIGNELLRQTVVFGWHVDALESLSLELNVRGIRSATLTGRTNSADRAEIQARFSAGEGQVVCAQIIVAGTAIDLSAASHGYFMELDWVCGNNAQAANRLVSMAKQEKVTFDIVTWPGSVDEGVQRSLLRRSRELGKLY